MEFASIEADGTKWSRTQERIRNPPGLGFKSCALRQKINGFRRSPHSLCTDLDLLTCPKLTPSSRANLSEEEKAVP